jgi:hypothetical protein
LESGTNNKKSRKVMKNKIVDMFKWKKDKNLNSALDKLEEQCDNAYDDTLSDVEKKGYRNLKKLIKNLREKQNKEKEE